MNCDKYTEWLSAALDGELTAEQRRELDAHLAQCPDCATLFELLSANAAAMRQMDCEMPAGLHDRIMNTLPPQEVPAKKNSVIRWKRWGSLAACLVLVAAAAFAVPGMSRSVSKHAPTAAEAAEDPRHAPEDQAPGSAQSSRNDEFSAESSKAGGSSADPMAVPSSMPSVLPQLPPASEQEPDDDRNFGDRPVYDPNLPGTPPAGELAGKTALTAHYLRMSYGKTPAPSVTVITDADRLADYLKGFGTNRYDGEGNPVPNEALEALKETYGRDWFDGRCLAAVVVESGSGSTRYEVMSLAGSTLSIRVIVPEVGTADMAAWLILVELDEIPAGPLTVDYSF